MTTNTTNNILDNLCVVHTDFDIWSGQTRLNPSDLKLGDGGEIPPERLAQLGSKKICDPAKLKGFHRLKTECRRMLLRNGMPFMNGYALPVKFLDEIQERLAEVESEFNQLRTEFVSGYQAAVEEWCQENPEYASSIRNGALPQSEVEKRIGFKYEVFMVQPVKGGTLDKSVQGLGEALIDEISAEAEKFYLERLARKDSVEVTTKKTIKNIRDKVDGLSFLNPEFGSIVSMLDEILVGYDTQAEGRNIVAPFIYQLTAGVLVLTSREKITQYATGSLSLDDEAQRAKSVVDAVQANRTSPQAIEVVEEPSGDLSEAAESDFFF